MTPNKQHVGPISELSDSELSDLGQQLYDSLSSPDISYTDLLSLSEDFFDTRCYRPDGVSVEYGSDGLPIVEESSEE